MKVWRGTAFRLIAVSAILILAVFSLSGGAFSKTVVTKTGECTREVVVKMQIFSGGPHWTPEELAPMPEDQRKRLQKLMDNYTSYNEAQLGDIAKEWKAEIENLWNGPTWDQVKGVQDELGISDADLDKVVKKGKGREDIVKKINEHLKKFGGGNTSCAEINCCKIYFKADIKVRKPGERADPDYHQIRVMKKGWRSSITTHDEGLDGNQKGTSGKLGYDPDNPQDASVGHETGHLMGLDDQYTDAGGTKEGHQHDMMDWSYGFPQEDALDRILKLGGAECDCCPRPDDDYFVRFNRTFLVAGDAVLTKNCPILRQTLNDLQDQLSNVQQSKASITARATLTARINDQIAKIKKALEDCPKQTPATDYSIGTEGFPFSGDSLVCVFYGSGPTIRIPLTPFGPSIPTGPQTPGTTPPDTRPPETTPGPKDTRPPATTAPPPAETPTEPGQVYVPFDPGEWTPKDGIYIDPGMTLGPGGKEIVTEPVKPLELDTVVKRHPGIEHKAGTPEGGTFIGVEIVDMKLKSTQPIEVQVPEEKQKEEQKTGVPTPVFIVKAEKTVIEGGQPVTGPAEGTVQKLGFPPPPLPDTAPRTAGATNDQSDKDPRQTVTDKDGIGVIFADGFESGDLSSWSSQVTPDNKERFISGVSVDMTEYKSDIVYLADKDYSLDGVAGEAEGQPGTGEAAGAPKPSNPVKDAAGQAGGTGEGVKKGAGGTGVGDAIKKGAGIVGDPPSGGKTTLPGAVGSYVTDAIKFGDTWGVTLTYPYDKESFIDSQLADYDKQENHYRIELSDDPYYNSKGTWGQPYDDQWAIKHVGFVEGAGGAWAAAGEDLTPVVVAVIDTGLDWNHADISWDNIWRNEGEIPNNGIDDDNNGYVDDYIGWNFQASNPVPWDQDGHGTFIAGMIAAAKDNGIGIAGMNPAARIMVLKALNDFGHTRASYLARAIKYATDNGARVINISVGGDHLTYLEELAVKYAHDRGVVVVVAAGNSAKPVADFGLSPYEEVISVAATDTDDKRVVFSNYGPEIDVAAPGVDVLSLRARRTDLMRDRVDIEYQDGAAYVGDDKRYYRVSGTSFSAPMVSAVASLILAKNPGLTNVEVERMIRQSAKDVEIPGHDSYTGYGLLDAAAAISADPAFEIVADITSVQAFQDAAGNYFVDVSGFASANDFDHAAVFIGAGENPTTWKQVSPDITSPVAGGSFVQIPAGEFRASPVWTIRLVVTHKNGQSREEWFKLQLG